jgi:hypothetical protein
MLTALVVAAAERSCSDLSAGDFELIGEHAMGRYLGSGSAHQAMNTHMTAMMGSVREERMHQGLGSAGDGNVSVLGAVLIALGAGPSAAPSSLPGRDSAGQIADSWTLAGQHRAASARPQREELRGWDSNPQLLG